jgi:CRISPR/Cas system-associated endonuclease Cas1
VALLGARLDPDTGFLHDGKNSLTYDLADPFKPWMVDMVIFQLANEALREDDYELIPGRCMLSDDLIQEITRRLHTTISAGKINSQVNDLVTAIRDGSEFTVRY